MFQMFRKFAVIFNPLCASRFWAKTLSMYDNVVRIYLSLFVGQAVLKDKFVLVDCLMEKKLVFTININLDISSYNHLIYTE